MRELETKAIIENIPAVTDYVNEILDSCDCPMKAKLQIDVAIDEIVSNVALYAYDGAQGLIKIRVDSGIDSQVSISFIDGGKPYNPLEREEPDLTSSVTERKIGGLGIFIVKKTMDDVIYKYEGGENILTIVKKY